VCTLLVACCLRGAPQGTGGPGRHTKRSLQRLMHVGKKQTRRKTINELPAHVVAHNFRPDAGMQSFPLQQSAGYQLCANAGDAKRPVATSILSSWPARFQLVSKIPIGIPPATAHAFRNEIRPCIKHSMRRHTGKDNSRRWIRTCSCAAGRGRAGAPVPGHQMSPLWSWEAQLSGERLRRNNAWAMVRRRAEVGGITTEVCNRTFPQHGHHCLS